MNVNGNITFEPFTFTEAGMYTYVVKETSNYTLMLTEGVTLDTSEYAVIVEVTGDGIGGLTARQINTFAFLNKCVPAEASAELILQGKKIITGRKKGLLEKEFTFTASRNDGIIVYGYNDAFGNIAFEPIEFNRDDIGKTFTYTVRELIPSGADNNVKYDMRAYTVKVTVGYDAETVELTLKTDVAGGPIVFTNAYDTAPGINETGGDIPIVIIGIGNRNLGECSE
jgi:pilin isopeptide linkage protein